MTDYSTIKDDTPPEEYEQRRQHRAEQEEQRQREKIQEELAISRKELGAAAEKDARMRRIEEKLDQVLDLLRKRS